MALHDAKAAKHALNAATCSLQQCHADLQECQKNLEQQIAQERAAGHELHSLKSAVQLVLPLLGSNHWHLQQFVHVINNSSRCHGVVISSMPAKALPSDS